MISYDDVQTTIEPLHRQDLGVIWCTMQCEDHLMSIKLMTFFLNIAGALLSKLINSWLSIKKKRRILKRYKAEYVIWA